LPDDATLQQVRAPYTQPAPKQPPFVLDGDDLGTSTFWVGDLLNNYLGGELGLVLDQRTRQVCDLA
jgi:purine nucleoside permease